MLRTLHFKERKAVQTAIIARVSAFQPFTCIYFNKELSSFLFDLDSLWFQIFCQKVLY